MQSLGYSLSDAVREKIKQQTSLDYMKRDDFSNLLEIPELKKKGADENGTRLRAFGTVYQSVSPVTMRIYEKHASC